MMHPRMAYFLSMMMMIHHRLEHLSSESYWYNLDAMHMCNFHCKQIDNIYIHPKVTHTDWFVNRRSKTTNLRSFVVRSAWPDHSTSQRNNSTCRYLEDPNREKQMVRQSERNVSYVHRFLILSLWPIAQFWHRIHWCREPRRRRNFAEWLLKDDCVCSRNDCLFERIENVEKVSRARRYLRGLFYVRNIFSHVVRSMDHHRIDHVDEDPLVR